jgi:hypothetical protein
MSIENKMKSIALLDKLTSVVNEASKNSNNRFELWGNILDKFEIKEACEVGVWKGDFANYILSKVEGIEKYIFVDPWKTLPNWNKPLNVSNIEFEKVRNEAFEKNKIYFDKIKELRYPTKEAVKQIEDASLDFVYIDGDHTLRGITIDLISILPKIKNGGFIGGDDFTRNIWQHSDEFDPTEVFPFAIYFAEANDLTIFTLPFDQFLIVNLDLQFKVVDLGNYALLSPSQIYNKPKR